MDGIFFFFFFFFCNSYLVTPHLLSPLTRAHVHTYTYICIYISLHSWPRPRPYLQLAKMKPVHTALESLETHKIPYSVFDQVAIEPTDTSFKKAISYARAHKFDAFVAVGGGSVMVRGV